MPSEHTFIVPEGIHRERADKVLASAFPEFSRTALQRAFDAGLVFRDDTCIGKREGVSAGEPLNFSLPEARPSELKAVSMSLDILTEDEHFLAVNKPSGLVIHPGAGTGEDTLVHGLLAHCRGSLSGVGGVERPGIVHRLDKETSGIVLVAKTDRAHRELARQFSDREVKKHYLALVAGVPELLSGTLRDAIGRHSVHRHKMAVQPEGKGRAAHTEWERVEVYGAQASLLRCRILTGRTHQIRVHLSSRRHPLLGDAVYGYRTRDETFPEPRRIMLHAETLGFRHPATGAAMTLTAPLPADFREMIEALKRIAGSGAKEGRG